MSGDFTQVAPGVFIGGWTAARDHGWEFDVIVNCAIDAPNHGANYHFFLVDGPGNSRVDMQAAILCVEEAIRAGRKVLVHCVAGRSRSVTVAAAAISRVTGRSFAHVVRVFASMRGCEGPNQPHPALLELV